MNITPEEIARLRALEAKVDLNGADITELTDVRLTPLLDEIERLRDELDFQKRLRVPCECSADDACKFARERDEARADLAAVDAAIADRGVPERDCRLPLATRVDNIIGELKEWRHDAATEAMENEALRADLREAVALLRDGHSILNVHRAEFQSYSECNETYCFGGHQHEPRQRMDDFVEKADALLAKHKEDA